MIRMIRQMIRHELAPIMMGMITENADQKRSSGQRFQAENAVENMRSILPYGVSARAPAGTQCLMVPNASDPSHIHVVGHFDDSRPVVNDGEMKLYDANGNVIYLSSSKIEVTAPTKLVVTTPEMDTNATTKSVTTTPEFDVVSDMIKLGSAGSANPINLGDIVQNVLSQLLQLDAQQTHIGNFGYPTSVPVNAAGYTALKSSPVDDGGILSDKAFTEK